MMHTAHWVVGRALGQVATGPLAIRPRAAIDMASPPKQANRLQQG